MILLRQGKLEQALAVNRQSIDASPGEPAYRMHRARILAARGDSDAAADVLVELLASNSEFDQREEAEILLRELRDR